MSEHRLNLTAVKALKPGEVKWDRGPHRVRGFGARCQGRDAVFVLKYRLHGKQHIYTIGRLGDVTRKLMLPCALDTARTEAEWARGEIAAGRDPLVSADRGTTGETVRAVVADFIKRDVKARGLRSADAVERMMDNHVLPKLGNRHIRSIGRQDVVALLDGLIDAGKPMAAIKVRNLLSALFRWAVRRGTYGLDTSPVALVPRPATEKRRDRVLSPEEVAVAWGALEATGWPFGSFLAMALTLGQRRNEVAHMRWVDVDEAGATWTIPAEANKAGRVHVVPLPTLALEILAKRKKEDRVGEYVFTTTGKTPISGFSKAKRAVDKAIAERLTKMKAAGQDVSKLFVATWTVHDLRRTAATGMAALGTPRFVIARILNHADASVTGTYDRHAYLAEKRVALAQWSVRLESIVRPRRDKVAA